MYHCAHKIWSNKQALDEQISQIKTFMLWNGYPKRVWNCIIKQIETNKSHSRLADFKHYYFKVKVNIVVKYRTNRLPMFCPMKDRISWNQKANVIYIIQCPGCHNDYVGKKRTEI